MTERAGRPAPVEATGRQRVGRAAGSGGRTVATVGRAADVLAHFCDVGCRDLGVTQIAESLSMSKAGVHRILASLRSRGLIELDPDTHRYSLGPLAMRLGLTYLDRLDVRALAAPELAGLSARTGETATLSVRVGDARAYVDQVTPDREVVMSVTLGRPFPLHLGASSKALLAWLPEAGDREALARVVRGGVALGGGPVLDARPPGLAALEPLDELAEELAGIRARGWARTLGERQPGAASVAAPVLDHDGVPAAVVSVCGPAERFRAIEDDCVRALLQACRRVSARLGAPSAPAGSAQSTGTGLGTGIPGTDQSPSTTP
jgi:DNA-binding IclR family transcriptional regulator